MEGFLDVVASRVTERFKGDLSDLTFVLPGKRAYQILREKIAQKANVVSWEPEFTTLTRLVCEYSHIEKANDIVLLAKLFNICREKLGEAAVDNFDAFESWGRILIEDFSGIDSGMVDAKELFGNVGDMAEIDERFKEPEQEMESELILKSRPHPRDNEIRNKFDNLWEHLYDIYEAFRESLHEAGIGYSGMISRKAAEEFAENGRSDGKRYVMVGFNTFTESEYRFIKALEPEAAYWDEYGFFDDGKVNLKFNPDGSNIRKIGCPVEESIKAPTDISRRIEVIGCPTDFIQCKVARDLLSNMEHIGSETGVILADDALLPVMLQSLPENIQEVNVTTGRPIFDSPAYIFYQRLKSIILERRGDSYLRKDIEFILDYPCLKDIWGESESIVKLRKRLKENLAPIIDISDIDDTQLGKFFREVTKPGEYLMERLAEMSDMLAQQDFTEAAGKMVSAIETITAVIERYGIVLPNNLFISFLEKSFARGFSPYESDAMSGLQITGILETRCQDFKNLFILSADDDTLPKKSHMLSFIPTGIRSHYHLPLSGDFQRMSASYFYHLLMRAENVWIMYNSNSGDLRSGEPSRFIQQIRYLKPLNTTLSFKTATSKLKTEDVSKSRFFHSKEASEILSKRKKSASMMNTYLTCQKRFALTYIYRVKVPQIVSSDFKPSDTGTAVHDVLQFLCENGYCKSRAKEILENFEAMAMKTVKEKGFEQMYVKYPHMVGTGDMQRLEDLIVTQVKNVLNYDASHSEFKTIATEKELEGPHGFTMRIDRLDRMESDGTYRIVDYKSGKKEGLKLSGLSGKNESEKIERIFEKSGTRYKNSDPVLQTMLYGLAYKGEKVMPAIYSLPLMSDPAYCPYIDQQEEPILQNYIDAFGKKLEDTLTEMSDPDPSIEYKEMEDASELRCNLCDFKSFCGF